MSTSPDCLIHSHLIDQNGLGTPTEPVPIESIPTGCIQWVHFQFDANGADQFLASLGVSKSVSNLLLTAETRPRSASVEGGTLIVLRGVNTNPGADPEDMVSLRMWITDRAIFSARRSQRKLLSVEDIRAALLAGVGPQSSSQFIVYLVEKIADRISDVVDQIDEDLTTIETKLGEDTPQMIRGKLGDARRQTAALRRYLAPQRDALETLVRTKTLIDAEHAIDLHHQIDRLTRYVEDLDLSKERSLVLQSELQNQLAEQQNARMYMLAIVTALFLPLSFLTGVFGMNVAGLPGTQNPYSFVILSVIMIAIGLGLAAYIYFKKWL